MYEYPAALACVGVGAGGRVGVGEGLRSSFQFSEKNRIETNAPMKRRTA